MARPPEPAFAPPVAPTPPPPSAGEGLALPHPANLRRTKTQRPIPPATLQELRDMRGACAEPTLAVNTPRSRAVAKHRRKRQEWDRRPQLPGGAVHPNTTEEPPWVAWSPPGLLARQVPSVSRGPARCRSRTPGPLASCGKAARSSPVRAKGHLNYYVAGLGTAARAGAP